MENKTNSLNGFSLKNKPYLIMGVFLLLLFLFNEYDKRNREIINVAVENATEGIEKSEKEMNIEVFIFNLDKKILEIKEIKTKKGNLLSGDYITGIIKNTDFLTDDMKFLSSYILDMNGKNTMIVKLNSAFLDLKENKEQFEGFVESIRKTMIILDPMIEDIQIQIDGDKGI